MGTKKKNLNKNSNPKWGTEDWINAYPWSKMDRKRRMRVKKALGFVEPPASVKIIDNINAAMECTKKDFKNRKMGIPNDAISKAYYAIGIIKNFFSTAANTLIAHDLYVKWDLGNNIKHNAKQPKIVTI